MSRRNYRARGSGKLDATDRFKRKLKEATTLLGKASDLQAFEMLGAGALNDFLQALLTPFPNSNETSVYAYLEANKHRAAALAELRRVITHNYAIQVDLDTGHRARVSPFHVAKRGDGVYFLQGANAFEGLISRYHNGQVEFGITKRSVSSGESIDIEVDLEFVPSDIARERFREVQEKTPVTLGEAIDRLHHMIREGETRESEYQLFLSANPWVLGAEYSSIDRHTALDDGNIPDFTAVRVRRQTRDIVEIKPPTMKLFTKVGDFTSDFLRAWDQAERYLTFARENSAYLRNQKDLVFENPRCWLVVGYTLNASEQRMIERKMGHNPSITVLTYHDLLAYGRSTIKFILGLRDTPESPTP